MTSFFLLCHLVLISVCSAFLFSYSPFYSKTENGHYANKYKKDLTKEATNQRIVGIHNYQKFYRKTKENTKGRLFPFRSHENDNTQRQNKGEAINQNNNEDMNEQWIIRAAKRFSNETIFLNQAMEGQGSLSTLPEENNELLEYKPLPNYDEMIEWAKEKDRLIEEDKVPGFGGTNAEMRSLFHLYDSTKHPHTYRELNDSEAVILTRLADLIKKRVKSSQVLPVDDTKDLKVCLQEVENIMERDATHLRKTEFLLNRDKLRGRRFFSTESSPSTTISSPAEAGEDENIQEKLSHILSEQELQQRGRSYDHQGNTSPKNAATSPFEMNNRVDNPDFDPIYGSVEVRDKLYEFVYSLLVEKRPDYMKNKAGYNLDLKDIKSTSDQ